jgi:hypothetical protein
MVFTVGEGEQPTVSEAVSVRLGSITAMTIPVLVDIACVRTIPFHPNSSIQGNIADGSEDIVEKWISLSFMWSGRSFALDIAHSDRLGGLQ